MPEVDRELSLLFSRETDLPLRINGSWVVLLEMLYDVEGRTSSNVTMMLDFAVLVTMKIELLGGCGPLDTHKMPRR